MPSTPQRIRFYHSIVFKNLLLFLGILLVAIIPLALRYYQDSRDYEIQNWASKLEFFAERGASWLDVEAITRLTRPEQMRSPAYQKLLATLQRITREFAVDDAVVMRRNADGRYTYVAIAHGYDVSQPPLGELNAGTRNPCNPTAAGAASNPCSPTATRRGAFDIGQPVHIHSLFPATYQATNDTWLAGEMMHSQLFGGKAGDQVFDQFLQVNTPLKHNGKVVAILMLNKFANPLAAAVRAKTLKVVALSVSALIIGLTLFGFISARMLRPLQALTLAANAVAQGNLDLSVPVPHSRDEVGRLAETFQTMLTGLRQRDFIRDTFGRYLSPEIVAELLESPDGLKLGGETRELTLLVSDLRGFTTLASRLSPQEVITLLNRYLERMVDIITRYRGTVDEFQGDGILAFFGAPLAADDDPERAVACAIAMQRALVEINAGQRQQNLPELAMGIGINTGEVVVGNIGSEKRTKYGAVGSAINTAYRIESYTVGGQILISPSVYERVRSIVQIRGTLQVRFKGLDQPITLYDVIGLQGKYALSLPEKPPEACTPLDQPIPIVCYPVEGKAVSEQAISGYITGLAESVVEARLEEEVAVHADLKIFLAPQEAVGLPEVYARVLARGSHTGESSPETVRLGFTTLPEEVQAFLQQKRQEDTPRS